MNWCEVPQYIDGITTLDQGGLNPPIHALRERTDFLYNQLQNMTGNVGYSVPAKGFSRDCHKGTIVAMEDGLYVPAGAAWANESRSDGSLLPHNRSKVYGVLVTDVDPVTETGVILCAGWTRDQELINILTGGMTTAGKRGDYYLSPPVLNNDELVFTGVAQHESAADRDLNVFCYTYAPDGTLYINPGRPEYAGHSHNYVDIDTTVTPWVPIAMTDLGEDAPTGAAFALDTTADKALLTAIQSNPQMACLIKNGLEVHPSLWGTASTYICISFEPLPTDVFTLHSISPLMANEPLVRGVFTPTTSNLLTVTNVGGKVWIDFNAAPVDNMSYTGSCITSLTKDGVRVGPVVQNIVAGPGASVTHADNINKLPAGTVEVSVSQYKNTLIDMNLCNLNNVLIGTSLDSVYYVFPQGSESSLVGTMRIPHFSRDSQQGEIVLVFKGNSADISGMSARVLVQPTPEVGGNVAIPTSITHDVPVITGTNVGYCYCQAIQLGGDKQQLYSDGLLICELASSGSAPITLMSMSLRLL